MIDLTLATPGTLLAFGKRHKTFLLVIANGPSETDQRVRVLMLQRCDAVNGCDSAARLIRPTGDSCLSSTTLRIVLSAPRPV